jgi:lipopolysaccharide export system protein LptA
MASSRTPMAALALTVAMLALVATPASAQLAESGGPISYSADNLEYSQDASQLVLTGDVDVLQGDTRLRADRLTMIFAAGSGGATSGVGSNDIERMIAEGDVYYVRPLQQARGDRAVYETASDTVTFTGNVIVTNEDNVIRGQTLVLQVATGSTTVRAQPGRRVQGVVNPQNRRSPANGG